jgi:hypothetical protein
MLAVVYLGAIVLPLVLTVFPIGRRIARFIGDTAPSTGRPVLAPVPAQRPFARPPVALSPVAAPGPLQVVTQDVPSTKSCPDCAEIVLHSARVCKHCQFGFAPAPMGPAAPAAV